jgi:hypothetical protein
MQRVTILTREQLSNLNSIVEQFPDIPQFDIVETDNSGIGVNTYIKFVQGGLPFSIDITDVSNW